MSIMGCVTAGKDLCMRSESKLANFYNLVDEMVNDGWIAASDITGMTDDQISSIEKPENLTFPNVYIEFMRFCGCSDKLQHVFDLLTKSGMDTAYRYGISQRKKSEKGYEDFYPNFTETDFIFAVSAHDGLFYFSCKDHQDDPEVVIWYDNQKIQTGPKLSDFIYQRGFVFHQNWLKYHKNKETK